MNKIVRLGIIAVIMTMIEVIGGSAAFALTEAPGGSVTTIDELNTALGGTHEVRGNKITLQDDVFLKDTITLDRISEGTTIDTNGKSIVSGKSVSDIFLAWGSDLTLTGGGSYHTLNKRGHCVRGVQLPSTKSDSEPHPCTITIENGEFDLDADKNKIVIESYDPDKSAKAIINGGNFSGGTAVTNSAFCDGDQSGAFTCGPVDVDINKGESLSVFLYAPTKITGDMEETSEYGYNTITINASNSKLQPRITDIMCYRTKINMKGGTIAHIRASNSSTITIDGGSVYGKGIDVLNGSKLLITGGDFSHYSSDSTDREFILLKNSIVGKKASSWMSSILDVKIYEEGGNDTLKTYYGERRIDLIRIVGKSKLKMRNVQCVSTDSNKIVRSAFYLDGSKTAKPILIIQGKKGKQLSTKKFTNAIIRTNKYSGVKLAKHTLLKAGRKKYTPKQKLPKNIKGNIIATFKSFKSNTKLYISQ